MKRSTLIAPAIAALLVVATGGGAVGTPRVASGRAALALRVETPIALAQAAYARMTPAERLGQLFLVGVPSAGVPAAQLAKLQRFDIGSVILDHDNTKGRDQVAVATAPVATALSYHGVRPFISADQEGGRVMRLSGPGFAAIPTALAQGKWSSAKLRRHSKVWAGELLAAGVNLNLAPVADVVPAPHATRNQPIGRYDREYGHTPKFVAPHVAAFVEGMQSGGVAATEKHFPGLGRASGNTDITAGVTDPTRRHDPYLAPFRAGISAGARVVMVSSATYPHIDPKHLACYSKTIITGMLRGDLHFTGVVVSDDLVSRPMAKFSLAKRAKGFFGAGGTLALDTSMATVPAMIKAVRAEVHTSKTFAAAIKAAVLNVLTAKAESGLVP
jgi:beta-N-acetylhexosaminidase